jgi:hypothetical protein
MANPQFNSILLADIRSLPDVERPWLLVQLSQNSSELSDQVLAEMALAGQVYDGLGQ